MQIEESARSAEAALIVERHFIFTGELRWIYEKPSETFKGMIMGGRFGKYGDTKRKARIRRSGTFGKKNYKITPKTHINRNSRIKKKVENSSE